MGINIPDVYERVENSFRKKFNTGNGNRNNGNAFWADWTSIYFDIFIDQGKFLLSFYFVHLSLHQLACIHMKLHACMNRPEN